LDRLYDFMILAQGAPGAAPAGPAAGGAPAGGGAVGQPACGGGEQLLFMLGMLVLFYFLLIRPQQKRAKQHRELIGALKRGDSVITSSGIFGRIVEIDGNAMTLEIGKNTQIKILKSYVAGIANTDTESTLAKGPQAGT
jgi:preprotein translocase subunit YajC